MNTHPTFQKNREERWPDNKPEYYGHFFEKLAGPDADVNIATDHISINTSSGENGERMVHTHVINLNSEEQAQKFLTFLQNMDLEAFGTIKDVEFSFN